MPSRTAAKNRQIQGDGLLTPKIAKPKGAPAAKKLHRFCASVYPSAPQCLPPEFVRLIKRLEGILRMPVWMIIQNGGIGPYDEITFDVLKGFQAQRDAVAEGQPVALLIESPGGSAHSAYRIGRLFQRRSNDFTVVVPQYAKSAATLIALGAKRLLLGRDAELGPLDVQMFDPERESVGSALDAVQALERLNAFALAATDEAMMLYVRRTGKRTDVLLPHVLTYAANFVRPLLEKIDTVEYTRRSRELRVAEEYAIRLMKPNYPWAVAKRIAGRLVQKYPTHGFVIDRQESSVFEQVTVIPPETYGLGLRMREAPKGTEDIFSKLVPFLDSITVIGKLKEAA